MFKKLMFPCKFIIIFSILLVSCGIGKYKILSYTAGDGSEGAQAPLPRGDSDRALPFRKAKRRGEGASEGRSPKNQENSSQKVIPSVSEEFSCNAKYVKAVCLKGVCVQVEIADTEAKMERGLMFRESLPDKQGMLFTFEKQDIYSFWMKNMKIPLDIIWIDQGRKIVDISAGVQPCGASCEGISPKAKVKYALEVNAGFCKKNNVKVGDSAVFR